MNVRTLIKERLRARLRSVRVDGDVRAAVAANVGEPGAVTAASATETGAAESSGTRPRDAA